MAALRTPLRDSTMPPPVATTTAWMRSPTETSTSPSSSFSSSMSICASLLPPMLTNATFGPNADDDALDGLAPLESARLDRRLEHRREIFFLLAHCLLLGTGHSANYMRVGGGSRLERPPD